MEVLKTTTSDPELLVPASIGIIGYGIVGQALAHGFKEASRGRDRILYYDKYKPVGQSLQTVVGQSEFIFITLPTPMRGDESGIDLSIIDENIAEITPMTDKTGKIVVIKSTVVPGTTRQYTHQYPSTLFAFNPEFLTEANYLEDFMKADRTIIGAYNDLTHRRLADLYINRFPHSRLFLTDPTSAEMVKIAANLLLASRVTMANIFHDACIKLGVEWGEVQDMVATDPRIGSSHLDVTSSRGWGGKCFPKDWVNFKGICENSDLDISVLKAIWEDNKKRRLVHDWNEIPFAVSTNYQPQEADK